jgi:hypothetical protein
MWNKYKENNKENISKETKVFFKPKFDEEHSMVIASPIKLSQRSFKPTSPMRWTVDMRIVMLDGKKCNIEWGTQSQTIIATLAKYCDDKGNLKDGCNPFTMMMYKKDARTRYKFELLQ